MLLLKAAKTIRHSSRERECREKGWGCAGNGDGIAG